jgi:ribosomal protein L24E
MNTTQTFTKAGTITVKGRTRIAFRRDGKVFYFPNIKAKAVEANIEDAATWEE